MFCLLLRARLVSISYWSVQRVAMWRNRVQVWRRWWKSLDISGFEPAPLWLKDINEVTYIVKNRSSCEVHRVTSYSGAVCRSWARVEGYEGVIGCCRSWMFISHANWSSHPELLPLYKSNPFTATKITCRLRTTI